LESGEWCVVLNDPIIAQAKIVQRDGVNVIYSFKREDMSASKLIHQLSEKYRIRDLEVQDQPIEDVIRKIYEEQSLYN
jgi:ABC-2 type transport system ATP-binding protein